MREQRKAEKSKGDYFFHKKTETIGDSRQVYLNLNEIAGKTSKPSNITAIVASIWMKLDNSIETDQHFCSIENICQSTFNVPFRLVTFRDVKHNQ